MREDDAKKVIAETMKEFGRLDILVNNAGILEMGTIEKTSLEQYDRVMNVNMRFVSLPATTPSGFFCLQNLTAWFSHCA